MIKPFYSARLQTQSCSPGQRRSVAHAFTLVEMLVSMLVLSVLMIIIAQLLNTATTTIRQSQKRMDSGVQARMVLDRIGSDLAGMLRREDAHAIFAKLAGNDKMYFYTHAPGYFASSVPSANRSPLALAGYRVNSELRLERLSGGLSWAGEPTASSLGAPVMLTFPTRSPTNTLANARAETRLDGRWPGLVGVAPNYQGSTTTDFRVLGDLVFRIEFCFLRKDGTYSNNSAINSVPTTDALRDVSGIVIAIAVMDEDGRKISPNMSGLIAALPDALESDLTAATPRLMSTGWNELLNSNAFHTTAGIPQAAVQHIRIYQRCYTLGTPLP